MDDDDVHQLVVHVRPSQLGQRLLVRVVTPAERNRMLWPDRPGVADAEEKLRWDRERLLRISNTQAPEIVGDAARTLLAAAESLLPGAQRQVLEVRALLADLTDAAGDTKRAIAELEEALALARSFDAPAMSTSVLVDRLAMLREKGGDFEGAVNARREAVGLVRKTLEPDDPYIAGALGRLAETLAAAGRPAEAEATWDEAIHLLSELTGDDDQELRDLVSARSRSISAG
jgi:tetratricopeptide (TPR) repeat protein